MTLHSCDASDMSIERITVLGVLIFFSILLFFSFVVFPDVGEKILYGKNPPGKEMTNLDYSEIILSENYSCIESASELAKGDLPKFIEEFNKCN